MKNVHSFPAQALPVTSDPAVKLIENLSRKDMHKIKRKRKENNMPYSPEVK